MAIISTSEYKIWAGISGSAQDAVIAVLIASAQATLERFTGRDFDGATFTEYYNGGGTTIQLKNYPITSITSLQYRDAAGNLTSIPTTDWRVDLDTGIVSMLGVSDIRQYDDAMDDLTTRSFDRTPEFARDFRHIKVVYVGAYASTYPDDLKLVMYELVSLLSSMRASDPTMKSESIGAYSYTRGDTEDESPVTSFLSSRAKMFRTAAGA